MTRFLPDSSLKPAPPALGLPGSGLSKSMTTRERGARLRRGTRSPCAQSQFCGGAHGAADKHWMQPRHAGTKATGVTGRIASARSAHRRSWSIAPSPPLCHCTLAARPRVPMRLDTKDDAGVSSYSVAGSRWWTNLNVCANFVWYSTSFGFQNLPTKKLVITDTKIS